jgi:hypothetical protein
MNHACRPNTQYHFDPLTFTQIVYASRTIPIGEEIYISYTDPIQRRESRQATLKGSWGFTCTCAHCSLDKPFVIASDARISTIARVRKALLAGKPQPPLAVAGAGLKMARLMISLYEQELLYAPIADAYVLAALEAMGIGEELEALQWAHLAIERSVLYGGENDVDVKKMMNLVEEGRSHWSWMFRKKGLGKAEASGEPEHDEEDE